MDLRLDQKTALVCASSAGIGKAIAMGLAREGANVSIFSRTRETVDVAVREISAVAKGKVIANVCDLAKRKDIEAVVADTRSRLGPIEILVNNHGGPAPGTNEDVTDEQFQAALDVNLRSVFVTTRLCLPEMKSRRWGRVLNILSVSAKEPLPGMLLSNTMRPAILGFAKTIASEYAAHGITVNSLLPSAVLTNRARTLMEKKAERESIPFDKVLADSSKNIPVGHIASPEEFAHLAVFLCSDRAGYITGSAIAVDGGFSRGIF